VNRASRSLIRNRTRRPASSKSIITLRACLVAPPRLNRTCRRRDQSPESTGRRRVCPVVLTHTVPKSDRQRSHLQHRRR
jgi:hypothetical protein